MQVPANPGGFLPDYRADFFADQTRAYGGLFLSFGISPIRRTPGNIRETIPKLRINDHETHKTLIARILMIAAMGRQRSFGSNLHPHGSLFSPEPAKPGATKEMSNEQGRIG